MLLSKRRKMNPFDITATDNLQSSCHIAIVHQYHKVDDIATISGAKIFPNIFNGIDPQTAFFFFPVWRDK